MAKSQAKRVARVARTVARVATREAHPAEVPAYSALLRKRIRDPEHSKGQRTRWSLLAAAAEELEERGYRGLRVTDVNERAGVSNALFYLYFKNKDEITQEVMTGFLNLLYARSEEAPRPQSVEESIFQGNYDYLRQFAANPGLMRCLMQFGDESREFGRLWREASGVWMQRVVRRLSREPELRDRTPEELYAQVAALGTLVDGFLRTLYVEKESVTTMQLKAVAPDAASLALFLTRLWVRSIYAREMRWAPPRMLSG